MVSNLPVANQEGCSVPHCLWAPGCFDGAVAVDAWVLLTHIQNNLLSCKAYPDSKPLSLQASFSLDGAHAEFIHLCNVPPLFVGLLPFGGWNDPLTNWATWDFFFLALMWGQNTLGPELNLVGSWVAFWQRVRVGVAAGGAACTQ